ncbi:Conserved_hypothetical protein [Hexamita inflata]|uniref:Uncharacterized protein n=1 Tax=Hexamita inflata TaxID=28002 RepID=A0AA86PB19_9EUKA|nr:Conserved hypothetical protein [Hexamita inflata]CAI9954303.1 Conserved hypothetical protein [Hexamita inflata]
MTKNNLILSNNRMYHIFTIFIAISIEYIVEKITVLPIDMDEYLLNNPYFHALMKQGKYYGKDMLIIASGIEWHYAIAQIYSTSDDFVFVLLQKFVSAIPSLLIMSSINLSLGYICMSDYIQQITLVQIWSSGPVHHFDVYAVDFLLGIICLSLYQLSSYYKLNKLHVYIVTIVLSLLFRASNILYQFSTSSFTRSFDSTPLCQLYLQAIGFLIGELTHKFEHQPHQLTNKPVQRKLKTLNKKQFHKTVTSYVLDVLMFSCVYIHSTILLRGNSILNLVCHIICKVIYTLIIAVQFIMCLQYQEYSCKAGVIPGNVIGRWIVLSSQFICGYVIKNIQNTVVGPYHPRIFTALIAGMSVMFGMCGYTCKFLFNWMVEGLNKFICNIFNERKRKLISKRIKQSIYE